MAHDEELGKPSIEECIKAACREVNEMRQGQRTELTWDKLKEETKALLDEAN